MILNRKEPILPGKVDAPTQFYNILPVIASKKWAYLGQEPSLAPTCLTFLVEPVLLLTGQHLEGANCRIFLSSGRGF